MFVFIGWNWKISIIKRNGMVASRAGQYLNTVFKYIYCIYTLYLNTFFNLYLITVFKYFWSVFKYMYLNIFLNTFLHTPLNINNIEALRIDQLITGSNTSTQSHVVSVYF